MHHITPRWEWRAFGRRFGEAEAQLAALTPEGAQASDEIYLLSAAGGNVKVRNALVDIKVLKQVNAQGLEQWMPIIGDLFVVGGDRCRAEAAYTQPNSPGEAELDAHVAPLAGSGSLIDLAACSAIIYTARDAPH